MAKNNKNKKKNEARKPAKPAVKSAAVVPEAPAQPQEIGSTFHMATEEKLVFQSMIDKRKLAAEKQTSANSEMELAQMLQDQLQQRLMTRLSIAPGVQFSMRPDGTVVVMDGGKSGKAAEKKAEVQAKAAES